MKKAHYPPRFVVYVCSETVQGVPENPTNLYTRGLIVDVLQCASNLLDIAHPNDAQMAELAGAMNTGCLLANELTDGAFFRDHPALKRGDATFSSYYLQGVEQEHPGG